MKTLIHIAVRTVTSWRFLLNFVVILLVTSWVPLLSQTVVMRDEHGNIIHEAITTSRIYESWGKVMRMGPDMSGHLRAVLLHVVLCFAISFAVWYLTLYARARDNAWNAEGDGTGDTSQREGADGEGAGPAEDEDTGVENDCR